MPEVEEQLREYWTSVTAAQPPPMTADVMDSAPINEWRADPGHEPGGFTARRQLLAAAATIILVVGAVVAYALVGSGGDDDPTVTTDAPPAPEGRETEEVDDPEPIAPEQVDGSTDDGSQAEAAKVTGTAAETWLPSSAERDVAIIPWRGGFLAVRPADGSFFSGHGLVEAETWESPDGVEWSSASNIMFPSVDGMIRSDGEHVVVVGNLSEDELPDGVVASYVISASDDLVEWQTWDLTPDLSGDLPRDAEVSVNIGGLQVLPDGWAAHSPLASHFDEMSLFPPELRAAFEQDGVSWGEDESGITVTPEGGETFFLSWDDLGMDRATFYEQLTGGGITQRMVTADWEGELVVHQDAPGHGGIAAGPDGVLASDGGSGLRYSTDWETWSALPAPPWGAETLRGLARLPDGVVAVADAIWVGDSDGSNWQLVEHPRLDGRTIAATGIGEGFSAAAEGFVAIADLADYGDRSSPLLDPRIPWDDTYPPPELVVIASPDGERWLVEDVDVGVGVGVEGSFQLWRMEAIISGDRVLVHRPGEEVLVFEVE